MTEPEYGVLHRAAGRLRESLAVACPESVFESLYPNVLTRDLRRSSIRELLPLALLWLAGPYRRTADGWLIIEETDVEGKTFDLLTGLTEHGPAPERMVLEAIGKLGVNASHGRAWIDRRRRFQFRDGLLLRWSGSYADKAQQILRLVGTPLTRDDLISLVGDPIAPGTLRNYLNSDPRFVRVSLTEFGLREWGLEEYTTIEEEIAQEIERQGGEATVASLVQALTRQFGVAESSVRLYLSNSANFARNVRGNVVIGQRSVVSSPPRPIELARNCYYSNGAWSYRLTVTADALRGVSPPISSVYASHLGINADGDSRIVFTAVDSFRIARNPTATNISSLRAILNELEADIGDFLFLRIMDEDKISFHHVSRSTIDGACGLERLALHLGITPLPTEAEMLGSLAVAVGLPRSSSCAEIRARFHKRSEEDLAALLPQSDNQSAEPTSTVLQDPLMDLLGTLSGGARQ